MYLLYHTCTILYIDSNFSPQISCSIGYNIYSQIIDVFHLIVYSKSAMHADELSLLCLCFTIQHIFVKKNICSNSGQVTLYDLQLSHSNEASYAGDI